VSRIDTAKKIWGRTDVQFIAHCAVVLGLLVVIRPMFTRPVPDAIYEAPSIFWALLTDDVRMLIRAARRKVPAVPQLLFLLVPTLLLVAARVKLRWEQWENGKALRNLVMFILILLTWTGATYDYNLFLDQGHFLDRLILVGLTTLCWWFPIAVPLAVKWVYVMLKESYVPIPLDDFDFRAVHEFLVVFSVFAWLGFRKSFKSEHFLLVGIGCWASYYYAAGVAKLNYGPEWSWVFENHLSNLSVGAYVRGWPGFVPEETFLGLNRVARALDTPLSVFTLVFELATSCIVALHSCGSH
jgi:hypothetical protein